MTSFAALFVDASWRLVEAAAAGVRAVNGRISGRRPNESAAFRFLRKPYRALRDGLAMLRRATMSQVTYVGVTGSCGKTTTAKLIATIFHSVGKCQVHNVPGAVASHLLAMPRSIKFLVEEIYAWPATLRAQTRLLRPQIGVVTTIGSDHYKRFRSLEATAREKGKLVEYLPARGAAILNADDPHVCAMAQRTRARVITYGRSPDAEVRGTDISSDWPDRLALTVVHADQSMRIQTQLVGEHWTTSVLAAIACGIACGLDLPTCVKAIEAFEPLFARYSVHRVPAGPVFVLDHKSPAWTIEHGLAFLKHAGAPRKTIILGTISDYPGSGGSQYRRVARAALAVADRVIFVGPQSGHVGRLRQAGFQDRLFAFQTAYEASIFMSRDVWPSELILVKGSIAVDHLERILLSQTGRVVCWRESCGRHNGCPQCRSYRRPHRPPFGLAKGQGTAGHDMLVPQDSSME
jgi:UDP-N-acetylmuramoyl-tripeptide--D-alanyl-D-alanine ligase